MTTDSAPRTEAGVPAAQPSAEHKRGDVHRDQHGNVIEDYHVCGCQPAAADEGLRLLRGLTDAVDGAPADDYWTDKREPGNKPWNEARAYLDAHPEPTNAPTRRTSDGESPIGS